MVKTGQTWSGVIVCKDSTGALSTPTVGPAGVLYVDGVANAASVTISGSNPYKWTVTLPALTAGQCVSMYITATIATIATASVVAEEVADTKLTSDLNDIAATAIVSSGAITTSSGAVSTVTTLTNTPGDSSGVTTLLSRLSATRAGYLDNLSAGASALEASVQTLLTRLSAARAGYLDYLAGWTASIFAEIAGLIDTLLSSNHGAGAWGATSPSGEFTVTITVRNATTLLPIPNAQVTIKDSGDTTINDQKYTNASGQAIFSLDAATYKAHVGSMAGYSSLAAQTLVVSANTSATYDVTPISVGTPTSPSLCRVYGYEYRGDTPISARSVVALLENLPQTTTTTIQEIGPYSTVTDANGYWYLDLVRGKRYHLLINEAGVDKDINVPDASTVDASTLV